MALLQRGREVKELRVNAVGGGAANRVIRKIPTGSVPPGFKPGRTRPVAMFMIGWITIQILHALKNLVNGRINGVLAGREENSKMIRRSVPIRSVMRRYRIGSRNLSVQGRPKRWPLGFSSP